mmetsp:Transcript_8885/g.30523  ORF Transcript_8885/g.30523 Transcript_8885/m.30523 type:complete len:239 (+) Transcript_8885:778-1494(+)
MAFVRLAVVAPICRSPSRRVTRVLLSSEFLRVPAVAGPETRLTSDPDTMDPRALSASMVTALATASAASSRRSAVTDSTCRTSDDHLFTSLWVGSALVSLEGHKVSVCLFSLPAWEALHALRAASRPPRSSGTWSLTSLMTSGKAPASSLAVAPRARFVFARRASSRPAAPCTVRSSTRARSSCRFWLFRKAAKEGRSLSAAESSDSRVAEASAIQALVQPLSSFRSPRTWKARRASA